MPVQECRREYKSKILLPGTADYETCRRNNPSGDAPNVYPVEIHVVHDTNDVVAALRRATQLGKDIGVRSGGHLLTNGHLFAGILIDTTHLNRRVEYDPATHEINFGPSVRVKELAETLRDLNRFYPHGHCPTVAAGGFHLGAGQGVGMRGWGPTYRDWLIKLEIVVSDGHVVTASRTVNSDLFWAARGGGPAFFGVITKYWGRTIRRSKWWSQRTVFDLGNNYKPLIKWFIEQSKATPKWGTELNASISHPERSRAKQLPDTPPTDSKLQFVVSNVAIADSEAEARTTLSAYEKIPEDLRPSYLRSTWRELKLEDLWLDQDILWHSDNNELWRHHSLCTDDSVDLDKVSFQHHWRVG